jgi:hypothetical protein
MHCLLLIYFNIFYVWHGADVFMTKNKTKKQTVNINNTSKFQDQHPIRGVYILLVFNILILISVNFNKQNVYGEKIP